MTQFLNVLELDNHNLVTIANVWLANESYEKVIFLTSFSQSGKILTQKVIDVNDQEASASQLLKASKGYWIAGIIDKGPQNNIVLIKLNASFATSFIYEIKGSNQEVWLADLYIQNNGTMLLPIRTYSKDEDFIIYAGSAPEFYNVLIALSNN